MVDITQKPDTRVTSMNDEIFATSRNANGINVYDANTQAWLQFLPVSDLADVQGIAACPVNRCLYVTDSSDSYVYKISRDDSTMYVRSSTALYPAGVSVDLTNSVVLVCCVEGVIHQFDLDLELQGVVNFQNVDFDSPWHIVVDRSATGGDDSREPLYFISNDNQLQLASRSRELYRYGNKTPGADDGELNSPFEMQQLANGNILVADSGNSRVILLDRTLKFIRVVLTLDGHNHGGFCKPMSICLHEPTGKLWFGAFNGDVIIENVSDIPELK